MRDKKCCDVEITFFLVGFFFVLLTKLFDTGLLLMTIELYFLLIFIYVNLLLRKISSKKIIKGLFTVFAIISTLIFLFQGWEWTVFLSMTSLWKGVATLIVFSISYYIVDVFISDINQKVGKIFYYIPYLAFIYFLYLEINYQMH